MHRFAFASNVNGRGFRAAFARKPRHPLVRLALGLLGLGVLALLVFFSVFVGVAMLGVGLMYRLWKQRNRPVLGTRAARAPARVIDASYRVVGKAA